MVLTCDCESPDTVHRCCMSSGGAPPLLEKISSAALSSTHQNVCIIIVQDNRLYLTLHDTFYHNSTGLPTVSPGSLPLLQSCISINLLIAVPAVVD